MVFNKFVLAPTLARIPSKPPVTTETTTETTVTTTTETTVTTADSTAECKSTRGDVNCDGKITVSDAILLARVVAEDTEAKIVEQGKRNAELDGEDGLSAADTAILLKALAGLTTL